MEMLVISKNLRDKFIILLKIDCMEIFLHPPPCGHPLGRGNLAAKTYQIPG